MQIKGEEFIRKVQIQQEREELERKLNELEEIDVSASSTNNDSIFMGRNNNNDIDQNEHELDNIMLGASNYSGDDNKKKYLILGIILVVLFLLTIIIIRLLTDDPSTKEDQFTSNGAASTEVKKLAENENIEENFQKIINERVKKDANEPMVPETKTTSASTQATSKTKSNESKNSGTIKDDGNTSPAFESLQKEAENYKPGGGISDEAMDQTIKKVEKSKSLPKEKVAPVQKQEVVTKEDTTIKKVETKKSIKDLVDSAPYTAPTKNKAVVSTPTTTTSRSLPESPSDSSNVSGGYFIQVGAFTKTPTDSYVANIRNAKLKYKVHQDNISGTTYNKVLIGPYSSKAAASQSVEDVKQKLNVTSAFVVKF